MTRKELLLSPEYWITKVQVALYNCAYQYMRSTKTNKTQLAEHLGVTKSYVSQLLNGDYDHRLSKFIELSLSFGYVPEITFKPIKQVIKAESADYNALSALFQSTTHLQGVQTCDNFEQYKSADIDTTMQDNNNTEHPIAA